MNCLDSSFLIDYFDRSQAVEAFLSEHADAPFGAPTVTFQEVLFSQGKHAGVPVQEVAAKLDRVEPLPFTHGAALRAAETRRALEGQGKAIGIQDALIGATALEHGATVITWDAISSVFLPSMSTVTEYDFASESQRRLCGCHRLHGNLRTRA